MGRGMDLSAAEKRQIVQCLGKGMKTLDISQKLKRDHRTVKRFVTDSEHRRVRADKGIIRKVSVRQIHQIKTAAAKMPLQSSKQLFEAAGASGVPRTSRWRILQRLAVKASIRPPLTSDHKQKRLHWAQTYMKTNFQTVFFTDKCCATLDCPDGWSSGWVVDGHHVPTRLRRQQRGDRVMFWAGIMGRELVGPFRVPEGGKMTSTKYIDFLTHHFLPWYKKKSRAFSSKIIFIHDNAPSHAARNTTVSLAAMGIKGEKLMVWPPSSPDLNPMENLWSFLKEKIYEGGTQFTSKQQLWKAILTACKEIQAETIHKLTSSMDARIVKVISKKGSYVDM
uniref:Tc1-like transposase DDE domain-containing protein n=1 Tax=Poecilia formosa TaxID=48698 RepID=A0A087YR09_POEFO